MTTPTPRTRAEWRDAIEVSTESIVICGDTKDRNDLLDAIMALQSQLEAAQARIAELEARETTVLDTPQEPTQ